MLNYDLEVAKLRQENALAMLAEKEMSYIIQDLNSIATQASLIAGFTYSTIANEVTDTTGRHESNLVQDSLVVGSNTLCIVVNLVTVMSATLVMTSGPYRALTGDENNLWSTLRSLRKERTRCIRLYWWGLTSFFLSLIFSIFFGPFNINSRYVLFCLAGIGTLWAFQTKRHINRVFGYLEEQDTASPQYPGASPGIAGSTQEHSITRSEITVFADGASTSCPQCTSKLIPGMPYCSGCGSHVRIICPRCKDLVDFNESTCQKCGMVRSRPRNASSFNPGTTTRSIQEETKQSPPPPPSENTSSSVFPILSNTSAARRRQQKPPTATAVVVEEEKQNEGSHIV